MKKKLCVMLVLVLLLSVSGLFAQGLAVLDVANLMQSIETVYQTYQNIQNTIQQVQNQAEQIKQTYQQMASMNWDDFKNVGDNFKGLSGDNWWETTGNFITATRNSAQDIVSAVDNQMNKVNRFSESLTKKTISFGGMDVSVADLCGFGDPGSSVQGFMGNALGSLWGTCQNLADTWAGNLTYEQKQAVMNRYGMSPENYATLELANAQANDLANRIGIMAHGDSIRQQLLEAEESAAITCKLIAENPEGNSYAMAQIQATQLAQIELALHQLGTNITQAAGLSAADRSAKQTMEIKEQFQKAKEEEKARYAVKNFGQGGSEKIY